MCSKPVLILVLKLPNLAVEAFYVLSFFLQRLVCLFSNIKGFMCLVSHVLIKMSVCMYGMAYPRAFEESMLRAENPIS